MWTRHQVIRRGHKQDSRLAFRLSFLRNITHSARVSFFAVIDYVLEWLFFHFFSFSWTCFSRLKTFYVYSEVRETKKKTEKKRECLLSPPRQRGRFFSREPATWSPHSPTVPLSLSPITHQNTFSFAFLFPRIKKLLFKRRKHRNILLLERMPRTCFFRF
jgi:hypothetical protein